MPFFKKISNKYQSQISNFKLIGNWKLKIGSCLLAKAVSHLLFANRKKSINHLPLTINRRSLSSGFTLIELLVACHPKPWRRKAIRGFTLIELLVVMVLLGTLASAVLYSTGNARDKGKDFRRKQDLQAISTALVSYYVDNKLYPAENIADYKLDYASDDDDDNDNATPYDWIPNLSSYINKLPVDPLQAGLTNLLAGFIKQQAVHTTQFLASIISSPSTKTSRQGQVAGATTWTISFNNVPNDFSSLTFDSENNIIYAGSDENGIIYSCVATPTGCIQSNWVESFNAGPEGVLSLTFDSENDIIYAGLSGDVTGSGKIYSCIATPTGCTNWVESFNAGLAGIEALTFDSKNNVIYAGTYFNISSGKIYSCVATSTGCTNWVESYNPGLLDGFYSLTFDSVNWVVYAGSAIGGKIYSCVATPTGCTNWVESYAINNIDGEPDIGIYSLTFDSVNWVVYAGSAYSGKIYSCVATPTGCIQSNWVESYNTTEGSVQSLNSINGVIYAGTATNSGEGKIYSCVATPTGCTNWVESFNAGLNGIYALTFDSENRIIYAGSGRGYIYRTAVPAPPVVCDPPTLTTNVNRQPELSASGGDGINYSWAITSGTGVTLSPTSGTPITASFTEIGFKTIMVTSGTQTDSCTIEVRDIGVPVSHPTGACNDKTLIYCYRVSVDKKSFILWAQLENLNDPEIYNSPADSATCNNNDTTIEPPTALPDNFLNYCLKSPPI